MSRFLAMFGIILILGQWPNYAHAQFDFLQFNHYSVKEGIVSPRVTDVNSDNLGFLWISTKDGVSRFDGTRFENYTTNGMSEHKLSNNHTILPIFDRNNNVWVGSTSGLNYFDRSQNRIYQHHIDDEVHVGLQPTYYSEPFFIDHLQNVWIYLNGKVLAYQPKNKRIKKIAIESNGYNCSPQNFYQPIKKLISNESKGFYIYTFLDNKPIETKSFFLKPNDSFSLYLLHCSFQNDSIAWLSTTYGLLEVNIYTYQINFYKNAFGQGLSPNGTAIYQNRYLFVSTSNNGLLLFDLNTKKFLSKWEHMPYDSQNLLTNHLERVYITPSDELVVVYHDRGIAVASLRSPMFKTIFSNKVKENNHLELDIKCINRLNDSLVILGTQNNGIIKYNIKSKKSINHWTAKNSQLGSNSINQFLSLPNGNILILNKTYLSLFDKRNEELKLLVDAKSHHSSIPYNIYKLSIFKNGIYAASEKGAQQLFLNNNTFEIRDIEEINKQVDWSHFNFIDFANDTTLFIQSHNTALYRYRIHENKKYILEKSFMTPYMIYDHCQTRKDLYFATSSGLYVYNSALDSLMLFSSKLTKPCYSIVSRFENEFWLGEDAKMTLINLSNSKNIESYTSGLNYKLFNANAEISIGDNALVGTKDGLISFEHKNKTRNSKSYIPYITHIQINEKFISDTNPNELKELKLNHNQNSIAIHLSNIGFEDAENNIIKYQLIGENKSIVSLVSGGQIRYPNLSPNHYIFKIYDAENKLFNELKIIIDPPFWNTWWFRLIALIFLFLFTYLLFQYRAYQYKKNEKEKMNVMIRSQENERKRIAQDLHDNFGAKLSAIKMYLQTAIRETNHSKTLIHNSIEEIDNTIVELRHLLINLSPKTLAESGLNAALREIKDIFTKTKQIEISLDIDYFDENNEADFNYNIYRIILELVHNTLKYAQAKHIYISLVSREQEDVVMYSDDGIGFDSNRIKRGYGIKNIESYSQNMSANLVIESQTGHGVQVVVEIPKK